MTDSPVAVVTGAASGMGRATATLLASRGATVAMVDVNGDALVEAADTIPGASTHVIDITESKEVDAGFAEIVDRHGTIDWLAHVAGLASQGHLKQRVSDHFEAIANGADPSPLEFTRFLTDDDWQQIIRVNLDGTFHCVRAALNVMGPKRRGAIVTVASNAAEGIPYIPHYSASKAAVIAFTTSVAKEALQFGVRVNCIAPGAVDTAMWARNPEFVRARVAAPMGRIGRPEEIASVIAFLLSDESSYIACETITVSGGGTLS